MPTWAKVLIITMLVLALLVAALIGVGVYVWKQNGPQFIANTQKAMSEGAEFGKASDNQGCLQEGIARHKQAEGFAELIGTNLFLRACLEASAPTPNFCDGVPEQTEFMKSAQWQPQQCSKYGLSTTKQCGQLFVQVQQYCESSREQSTPDAK